MPVEVCSYRLILRGRPVGTHTLRTHRIGKIVELEAKLMLQGGLGQQVVTQLSRVHAESHHSLSFSELLQDRSERRRFDVTFNAESGLVQAGKGKERAEIPYLHPFEDPLGLLHHLRQLPSATHHLRVPMLGKDVIVERLPDTVLEHPLGQRTARAYLLRPGESYVYVDDEPPHTILKLTQRLEGQRLDALLVKVAQEAPPARHTPMAEERSRRGRPRRRRGRRRSA